MTDFDSDSVIEAINAMVPVLITVFFLSAAMGALTKIRF